MQKGIILWADKLKYTMTQNGPVVTNILLDGILPDDVTTPETIKRPFRKNLNYPLPKK